MPKIRRMVEIYVVLSVYSQCITYVKIKENNTAHIQTLSKKTSNYY